MKKIILYGLAIFILLFLNVDVYAASANLSVSSNSVNDGDTFSITVNLRDVAAWNVKVSATGPVSGCSISEADVTSNAANTNKTFTSSCKATGTGDINVVMSGDISSSDLTTFDIFDSKTVSASRNKEDFAPTGSGDNQNNQNNNGNSNNTSNSNKNNTKTNSNINTTTNPNNNTTSNNDNNKSSNINIKSIAIDGEKLEKIDDNNYQAVISYSTKTINIKVETEDPNAKIFGAGSHNVNVGRNNISVVVVADDGSKNKINIKVVRADGYTLEELDTILEKNDVDFIDIKLDKNYVIPAKVIKSIKKSKKTVSFNFYDDNYQLMYSWIIDGSKIKSVKDFDTSILLSSEYKNKIVKLSGFSDGIYLSFKFKYIPFGTKLNMYVGDKYSNKDILNVYEYNKKKNSLYTILSKGKINNGFIKFDVENNNDYFITDSKNVVNSSKTKGFSILFFGVCLIVLVSVVIITVKRKNKKNL